MEKTTSLLIPLAGLLCLALVILGSLLAGTEERLPPLAEVLPDKVSLISFTEESDLNLIVTARGWLLGYEQIGVPMNVKEYKGGPAPIESGRLNGQTEEKAAGNEWYTVKTTRGLHYLMLQAPRDHVLLYRFKYVLAHPDEEEHTCGELLELIYGLRSSGEVSGVTVFNAHDYASDRLTLTGRPASQLCEALQNAVLRFSWNQEASTFTEHRNEEDYPSGSRVLRFVLPDGSEAADVTYYGTGSFNLYYGCYTPFLPEEETRTLNEILGLA